MNKNVKIYEKILDLYNNKQFKKVEEYFEQIISKYSRDLPLLNILASSLIHSNNYIKALEVYKKILLISPDYPNINLNLGNLCRLIGDKNEAIRYLLKEVSLNGHNFATHYNLALSYEAKKESINAINHYEQSLKKLTIQQKDLINEIGEKYIKYLISLGKNSEALSVTKELIIRCTESDVLLGLLGNLYTWKGEHTLAIEQYYKALKINEKNKTIKYDLSFCLRRVGRLSEAIEVLKDLNYLNSRAFYIENLFLDNKKEEFIFQLREACNNYPGNRLLANLSKYASMLYGIEDEYPFCKEPYFFTYQKNILKEEFIDSLIEEIFSLNLGSSNQELITNGKQSAGNLFNFNSKNINLLKDIINEEILNYKNLFREKEEYFIDNWPENYFLNSWYINLFKGGSLGYHYHHEGWISGTVYLKMPETRDLNEGSIEFSYNNENYSKKINSQSKLLKPEAGDIIIFPSSLNHRVNPFEGKANESRISVAFDLVPSD